MIRVPRLPINPFDSNPTYHRSAQIVLYEARFAPTLRPIVGLPLGARGGGGGGGGRKSDSPPSLIPFARKGDAPLQIESMSVEPAYQLQGPTGTSGTVPTSLALFQVPKPIPAVPRRAEARPSDTP